MMVIVDISQLYYISGPSYFIFSIYLGGITLFLMNQDASCCTLANYTKQLGLTVVGAAFLTE